MKGDVTGPRLWDVQPSGRKSHLLGAMVAEEEQIGVGKGSVVSARHARSEMLGRIQMYGYEAQKRDPGWEWKCWSHPLGDGI